MMALPALRGIDAFPVHHDGQQMMCIRDPEGVTEAQLLLTPAAFFIACQLDGQNDLAAIQAAFARQFRGQRLPSEQIRQIVAALDEHGLLLTERYTALCRALEEAFYQAEVRPAYLAGKSYPEQPEQLRAFLDAFFVRDDGPGRPPEGRNATGTSARCLVAPHIDFQRGGHAYAHGYGQFAQQPQPETVIIFGVAHAAPPVPFLLTRKHFATPFGTLHTDQDIVQRLAAACAWEPYAYEMIHRTEHSIEFQAVMLSYLYGTTVKIVPILCGLFGPTGEAEHPAAVDGVARFLETCQTLVAAAQGRISVIAGADLAHVGRRFGDAFEINDAIVQHVAARDQEDLQYALRGDAEGFYRSVMQDRNRRRVCGLACIYAALKASQSDQPGRLLHYDYAHDPAGGIVSFTNILFA